MANHTANHLLDSIPDAERLQWPDAIEPVHMTRGQVLHAPGSPSAHAWFPVSATVSILNVMENGASAEIALVGSEGAFGWSLPSEPGATRYRAVVSEEGEGFRVRTRTVAADLARCGSMTRALLPFTRALLAQISQLVLCNRYHLLEQQLCRMLLSSLDRIEGQRLDMTHDWMATRLGVRREGISLAARDLQRIGAISYRRGRIDVHDRSLLEARSCECYAVIAAEYGQLLR